MKLSHVRDEVSLPYICAPLMFRGHKGLEAFYKTGTAQGIQLAHAAKLSRILDVLNAAKGPEGVNIPSFRLHPLKGELKGRWAVWVNGNWRVTFAFVGINVELVGYQDYH